MNWLGRVFRKAKLERQLDSELRFHVEHQTADNIAAGMNPDEARRRALAQFGGLEYIKGVNARRELLFLVCRKVRLELPSYK